MADIKKILLYVNDSHQSKTAVKIACTHAQKIDAVVEMISIIEPANSQSVFLTENFIREEMEEKAQKIIASSIEVASEWPEIKIVCKILKGSAPDVIANSAMNDSNITIIILSVSEAHKNNIVNIINKLETSISVPILIVPGNLTDQQITDLYTR